MFKKKKVQFKGLKGYAIARESGGIICFDENKDAVIQSLDRSFPILVELTVTRVFTRENELKEIETDHK